MPRGYFKVEKIVGQRIDPNTGKIDYRIKWQGYNSTHNTWEPQQNLERAQDMIAAFYRCFQEKMRPREKKRVKVPGEALISKVQKPIYYTKQEQYESQRRRQKKRKQQQYARVIGVAPNGQQHIIEDEKSDISEQDPNFVIEDMYKGPKDKEICFQVIDMGIKCIMPRRRIMELNPKALLHFYQKRHFNSCSTQ